MPISIYKGWGRASLATIQWLVWYHVPSFTSAESQSVAYQCLTHRLLVISAWPPSEDYPDMKERETSRDKDEGREGGMVRCLEEEQRIKEIIFFLFRRQINVHMFVIRNHCSWQCCITYVSKVPWSRTHSKLGCAMLGKSGQTAGQQR